MNTFLNSLDVASWQKIGVCLMHFIWQGALLGCLAVVALHTLRNGTAATRYRVALTIFAAMGIAPLVTYGWLASRSITNRDAAVLRIDSFPASAPRVAKRTPSTATQETSASQAGVSRATNLLPAIEQQPTSLTPTAWLPLLMVGWLAGVALCSLRLLLGLGGAWRVRRSGRRLEDATAQSSCRQIAERLGIRQAVRLCESALVRGPVVVGWWSPVVLMPMGLAAGLHPEQLRAILTHELAHIRRLDYLVNLLQILVETLLFYHPAVWWLSCRLREERENCCDDIAAELCEQRVNYGRALLALEEFARTDGLLLLGARGGSLVRRLRRLLAPHNPRQLSAPASCLGCALIALTLVLTISAPALFADAAVDEPVAASSPAPTTEVVSESASNDDSKPAESLPVLREVSIQIVDARDQPVVGAKVVPWGVSSTPASFGLNAHWAPPTITNAQGIAQIQIRYPSEVPREDSGTSRIRKMLIRHLNQLAVRIEHLGHPTWSDYVTLNDRVAGAPSDARSGNEKLPRIVLSDGVTIKVRVHRANEDVPIGRLYPALGGSNAVGVIWSQAGTELTIERVDLSSESASRWLRIVEVPTTGPARFSGRVDLLPLAGDPIVLEVKLRPGVRVAGKMTENVPRPVQNGVALGNISSGGYYRSRWEWGARAEVAEDGSFVFESLPADESLQVIALCDGWVSSSPSQEVVNEFRTVYGLPYSYHGPDEGVYPHLAYLQGTEVKPLITMEQTATCEVTIYDQKKQAVPQASVVFFPNQRWMQGTSTLLGNGLDTLATIKSHLEAGQNRVVEFNYPENTRYNATTNTYGLAVVNNLPGFPIATKVASQTEFMVTHDKFKTPGDVFRHTLPKVNLISGQTTPAVVKLQAAD